LKTLSGSFSFSFSPGAFMVAHAIGDIITGDVVEPEVVVSASPSVGGLLDSLTGSIGISSISSRAKPVAARVASSTPSGIAATGTVTSDAHKTGSRPLDKDAFRNFISSSMPFGWYFLLNGRLSWVGGPSPKVLRQLSLGKFSLHHGNLKNHLSSSAFGSIADEDSNIETDGNNNNMVNVDEFLTEKMSKDLHPADLEEAFSWHAYNYAKVPASSLFFISSQKSVGMSCNRERCIIQKSPLEIGDMASILLVVYWKLDLYSVSVIVIASVCELNTKIVMIIQIMSSVYFFCVSQAHFWTLKCLSIYRRSSFNRGWRFLSHVYRCRSRLLELHCLECHWIQNL
ncbi:uncharacterized protein LOC103943700, partial [Pyrus x bretschneideri]|uniref:uncharacterized protein LOC103943700 n=1 Tax=Pyrus x bretschneideri TaxID=225117 RepID=UPI00202F7774